MNQRDLQLELRGVLDCYRSNGMTSDRSILIHTAVLLFLRWMDFYEAEQEAIAAFDEVEHTLFLPSSLRWASLKKLAEFNLDISTWNCTQLRKCSFAPFAISLHAEYTG